MTEERFNPEEADELTTRIASQLGERQQKLEMMQQWEKEAKHTAKLKPIIGVTALAACLAAFLILSPLWNRSTSPLDELGIEQPTMVEYRAASQEMAEINRLIGEENYMMALKKTKKALDGSDLTIHELLYVPELWENEEEAKYEERIELALNSELRWTYIYLLVKTGDNKTAKKHLKLYLKRKEYCEHEQEARALLEKIG